MRAAGVRNWRLHLLETEDDRIRDKYAMDTADNVSALSEFLALTRESQAADSDVRGHVATCCAGRTRGRPARGGRATYSTQAVRGVEGHGQRWNCGRTNKDGIDFVPAPEHGFERYLALHRPRTPLVAARAAASS